MRYRFIILGGIVLGGLVAYYFLWAHLIDQVAARAAAWIDSQRGLGREVSYDRMRLWGFPYRLSVTFENLSWRDPQSAADWDLQSDSITAHLQLWNANHVIFDLGGSQRLGWRSAGGGRQQAVLTAGRFLASMTSDAAGTWQQVDADIHQPKLAIGLQDWSAERLRLHGRRGGNVPPSTDLAVQVDNAALPPEADGPLGRSLAALTLVGNLRGAFYGKTPEEALRTWRESGGILDLSTIALDWDGLRLEGDGSLAVDRQLRPLGAMSGKIYGAAKGIDALQDAGRMTDKEAIAAKAALALLEQPDGDGKKHLTVPLSAQDGRLFLGPVPLFSLPSMLPAAQP
jgi:hypothetical protein